MLNFYLAATETIKPLMFALPNRFLGLCTGLFTSAALNNDRANDPVNAAQCLQQMAKEMESVQPSLAAELRSFASRS